jgi:hypothetical protein
MENGFINHGLCSWLVKGNHSVVVRKNFLCIGIKTSAFLLHTQPQSGFPSTTLYSIQDYKKLATITGKWLPNKAYTKKATPFGVIMENAFTNHGLCTWLVKGNHFVVIREIFYLSSYKNLTSYLTRYNYFLKSKT